MVDLKEKDIEIIERDFDVVDQDGDDRIGYEHYLKISNTPFFDQSEAKQLKQQILQDHEDAKKFDSEHKYVSRLLKSIKILEAEKLLDGEKDRQIVKRLEERIHDFQIVMEYEGLSEKNNELLEELQKILGGEVFVKN